MGHLVFQSLGVITPILRIAGSARQRLAALHRYGICSDRLVNRVMHHPKACVREILVFHPIPSAALTRRVFLLALAGAVVVVVVEADLRRRWRNLPRKSGGPPLFALSLKVQRNIAHNRTPGSLSYPGATTSTLTVP
jgi:hypothetical protein